MTSEASTKPTEYAKGSLNSRLNWLRAGVLGANDGIVSVAGLVIGVAAVDPTDTSAIALAGVAGLLSGAFSMAVGEYVSVSTQRDTERSTIAQHQTQLAEDPESLKRELEEVWEEKGVSKMTAQKLTSEMDGPNTLSTHLHIEHGIDAEELTNPWHAAISSFIAFTLGALLPIAAILLVGPSWRIPITFVSIIAALALTGWGSAKLGNSPRLRAVIRIVLGGAIAMGATWIIGHLLGVSLA